MRKGEKISILISMKYIVNQKEKQKGIIGINNDNILYFIQMKDIHEKFAILKNRAEINTKYLEEKYWYNINIYSSKEKKSFNLQKIYSIQIISIKELEVVLKDTKSTKLDLDDNVMLFRWINK